jgi:uncharacterized protein (DUF1015 family)
MALITPFRAVRPKPELSAQVAAPPYDVMSLEEARAMAKGNPYNFLRVSRAELEFPAKTDPYSSVVYERGAENLRNFIKKGILIQEEQPLLGVYRQRWENHEQTGLVALASIDEYDRGIIKRHEFTRPVKETDRVRIIKTHESQSGPVLLFFHRNAKFDHWLELVASTSPDCNFVADDGVEHTVWSVRDPAQISQLVQDFREVEALYIADGHHRCAAASRVRAMSGTSMSSDPGYHANGFLSVIFPHDHLQVLPYNRVVRDLNGLTVKDFIDAVSRQYDLQITLNPGTPPPHGFDMYLEGQWHQAIPKGVQMLTAESNGDPVRTLAVSVLTDRVLDPILGILDQRSDPRIDFVGGVRGPEELSSLVNHGQWAVAFWLYPTTVTELMAVSDAGRIMPPKSTWFEPKLRDGLFIHMLADP